MEKVRPWCGQPSDRGRLKNRNRTYYFLLNLCPGAVKNVKSTSVSVNRYRVMRPECMALTV